MFAYVYYRSTDPAQPDCVAVGAVPVDAPAQPLAGGVLFPGGGMVYIEISPYPTALTQVASLLHLPICPTSNPTILPHLIGAEVRRDLSKPDLHIAPGVAITGKPAYLEINRADERDIVLPNPLGGADVTVHVVPTYTIDWGDHTGTDITSSHGGPWPHGDITHVFQDASPVDVVVTVDWKVTWQGAQLPGTFQTNSRLHLPIEQVQAVIVPAG
jgi:hypothetical protein